MPLIGPRHGACYSALRRVNISKLHQKLRTSINLMVTSSCTVRTFPRVTTHKHLGVHINSRLSWQDHIDHVYTDCARKIGILRHLQRKTRVNSSSEDLHRSNPTTAWICLPRVEWGKYQQVGQTARTVLLPAPDYLTSIATAIWLSHIGVVLQDQNRTWPLLIWQSFCHNSLPTVVIIFEKICIPFLL